MDCADVSDILYLGGTLSENSCIVYAFVCTHPRDVIIWCEWCLCWWYLMIFIGTSDLCHCCRSNTMKVLTMIQCYWIWRNLYDKRTWSRSSSYCCWHKSSACIYLLSSSRDNFFLAISLEYDCKIARFRYFSMFTQFIHLSGITISLSL